MRTRANRLRLATASLLLTACASTLADTRHVVLESDAYGCGAAEGLGCGLAIGPVLVEIDRLEGVAASSVSWNGRHFRVELLPGADPERVGAAAAALLEGEACCVTTPRGPAEAGEPDRWYDAEGVVALSRHEAEVIASRFTSEIAAEAALDAEASGRLHAVLRDELEQAFERAHASGGGVHRLWEELPRARAGFEGRLDFLAPERRSRVLAILDREIGEE